MGGNIAVRGGASFVKENSNWSELTAERGGTRQPTAVKLGHRRVTEGRQGRKKLLWTEHFCGCAGCHSSQLLLDGV